MNIFIKKNSLSCLLIFLAGFLFLPKIVFAQNIEEISPTELKNYLGLSQDNTRKLLRSLTQVFADEFLNSGSSGYSTPQERAVPVFLRAIINGEILNYFLIDLPIEVSGKIIKNSVEIAKLLYNLDVSVVIEKFENESVNRAVNYGMNWLVQKEIKVATGAMQYDYYSVQGKKEQNIFQYIIIYKPIDDKQGEAEINFYSQNFIKPPKSTWAAPHDLKNNLPPFIVKIQGIVEKNKFGEYSWPDNPNIDIIFNEPVPDLGLRPLSWWERNLTEPIKSKIKEIQWIAKTFSERFGKKDNKEEPVENSSKNILTDIKEGLAKTKDALTGIFNKIKSTIDENNPFGASLIQTPLLTNQNSVQDQYLELLNESESVGVQIDKVETEITNLENTFSEETTIDNTAVEKFANVAEEINILDQKVVEIIKKDEQLEEQIEPEEEVKKEKAKEDPPVSVCAKSAKTSLKNKILINEVAWMGSKESANDEWVELKNITNEKINLKGWQFLDKEEQIKIFFTEESVIPAQGFFLLERTDDNSVPGILADIIYSGTINNSDETLYLFDENCQLQDEISASSTWPAGNNTEKRTMERTDILNWHTYSNNFAKNGVMGSPKENNSFGHSAGSSGNPINKSNESSSGENLELQICSQENLASPTTSLVIINEIAWMGSMANWRNEWIELKNTSTQNISLNNWQLLDKEEQIKIFFTEKDVIPAQGFFLLERDEESIPYIQANKIYSGFLNNENESLRLFDQNCNLIDEISASSTWPAGNNTEKRTMERNQNPSNWHTYSGAGENEIMGTPFKENSALILEATTTEKNKPLLVVAEQEESSDKTPPLVSFSLAPIQNSLNFPLSWSGTDPIGTDSPSGIDSFSILYTDSSSDDNTTLLQYKENENWYDWTVNEIIELSADKNQLDLKGINQQSYLFKIKAKDNAGNESSWEETTTVVELPLSQNVVITEIQLADNEFIELYNPTDEDIDISSWYFSYFPSNRDWNDPNRNKQFLESAVIPANGYYLIGLKGYPTENGNPDSDWQVYESNQLNDTSGSAAIFSCDPKEATTPEEAKNCKIDVLGWRETLVKERNSTLAPSEEKSLSRIKNNDGNYIDTNDNYQDFEIKEPPDPTNSKNKKANIYPSQAIADLKITNNKNAAILSWSIPTDQDTPVENFSYIIHYLKNQELDENSWTASTTLSTSTTSTSIGFPDLYYNSTYSFAVKTFDGWNYSPISNIVSLQIFPFGGILPATGQTTSSYKYDDGFYGAGCYNGYSDNGNGTITDNCTGLIWIKDGSGIGSNNGEALSWQEAVDYAENLTFAGYDDWRLPNYKELFSVVDYGTETAPLINKDYFSNNKSDKYWTSSPWRNWIGDMYVYYVYAVDFSDGRTYYSNPGKDSPVYYLRPVRGPENNEILPTNNPYFSYQTGDDGYSQKGCILGVEENEDGTKTDLCTGLMWYEIQLSKYHCTWQEAVDYAENLSFAGYDDWRLPNIKELVLTAGTFHRGIASGWSYWSSTADSLNKNNHWCLDNYLMRGETKTGNKIENIISGYDVRILVVRNVD